MAPYIRAALTVLKYGTWRVIIKATFPRSHKYNIRQHTQCLLLPSEGAPGTGRHLRAPKRVQIIDSSGIKVQGPNFRLPPIGPALAKAGPMIKS